MPKGVRDTIPGGNDIWARAARDRPRDRRRARVRPPRGVGRRVIFVCEFSRGFAHLTTRQNFQLHFVHLEKVAAAMQLPAGLKPLAILPVGYADEQPVRTSRRTLSEFFHEL